MSTIQPLANPLSALTGAGPVGIAAGEGIVSEDQPFAMTLTALLANYLESGEGQSEFLAEGLGADLAGDGDLAALAFALDADGQLISGSDGNALPQGLASLIGIETAVVDSAQQAPVVLPDDLMAATVETGEVTPVATVVPGGAPVSSGQSGVGLEQTDLLQGGARKLAADQLALQAQMDNGSSREGQDSDQSANLLRAQVLLAAGAAPDRRSSELAANLADGAAKAVSQLVGAAATLDAGVPTPVGGFATGAATSSTSATQLPAISASPHQPGFDNELGERVLWMTKNNLPSAEIRLNPAHLGPVEARVTVTNDQVSVVLTAHHSTTRDALEMALPRLREMFADAGITLSDANVAGQSSQQQHGAASDQRADRQGYAYQSGETAADGNGSNETEISRIATSGQGVLDVFA